MNQTDYDITEAMLKRGGGFVLRLAQAFRAADPDNQKILRDAFPGYWEIYAYVAEELAEKEVPSEQS